MCLTSLTEICTKLNVKETFWFLFLTVTNILLRLIAEYSKGMNTFIISAFPENLHIFWFGSYVTVIFDHWSGKRFNTACMNDYWML